MNDHLSLAGALGLILLLFLPVPSFAAQGPAVYGISDSLTRAAVGFAESATVIPEGSGRLDIGLVVKAGAGMDGDVMVNIAEASTAVEGVDFTIADRSLSLEKEAPGALKINLDILHNKAPGGRFLILEIALPDSSLAVVDRKARHIVLIQDKDNMAPVASSAPRLKLAHLGSFSLGKGASAEILAYDAPSSRLFVSNLSQNKLEVLDFSNPSKIRAVKSIHLDVFGGHINAVAARDGAVALAIEGEVSTDPGKVVFLNSNGVFISVVEVGAMPDMILFTPDGSKVLTANEGEPNPAYTTDPEGSVSVIDISAGITHPVCTTLSFAAFNERQAELSAQGIRIYGPGATVAQDLEPEYITISDDGATAYVTCQENNALAVVDINIPEITGLFPFGYKDWSAEGVTLDVSNRSGDIFFANWPLKGMYQPDAIEYFRAGGKAYLITANEGSAREYKGFTEEFRIKDEEIVLDEAVFPGAEYLKDDALLGRLRISRSSGDIDGDGRFEELYTFGGRSFSIWDATSWELVYDSGGALEQITADDPAFGPLFNSQNDDNDFKARSDDKGPEPAAVQVAEFNGGPFAFIALERIGGIMVFGLRNPRAPKFVQYINTRAVDSLGGDLSPEGLIYISPEESPTGYPFVLAAHEVSGTVAAFEALTPPAIGFAKANSIIEEGAGDLEIELAVERPGKLSGRVQARVIDPSSAQEGVDYVLGENSITLEEGRLSGGAFKVSIPDNDVPGSRYLILEIDPDNSTVNVGLNSRHIMLIRDNDGERARR